MSSLEAAEHWATLLADARVVSGQDALHGAASLAMRCATRLGLGTGG